MNSPRRRLALAALVGVAVGIFLPRSFGGLLRFVAIWDAVGLTLLVLVWVVILRATPESTRDRAVSEDLVRAAVLTRILLSGVGSLVAAVLLLRAQGQAASREALVDVLTLLAVVTAWALTHTYYALHYAHLYYRGEGGGGLEFPGKTPPAYMDFVYFALAIGTSFAGADVTVTSPAIRRVVVGHAALSFAYNTAILALALSLVSAQL